MDSVLWCYIGRDFSKSCVPLTAVPMAKYSALGAKFPLSPCWKFSVGSAGFLTMLVCWAWKLWSWRKVPVVGIAYSPHSTAPFFAGELWTDWSWVKPLTLVFIFLLNDRYKYSHSDGERLNWFSDFFCKNLLLFLFQKWHDWMNASCSTSL